MTRDTIHGHVFTDEPDGTTSIRPSAVFELIVGNIGSVYVGEDGKQAMARYAEYVEQSKSGRGRAGGETVTLLRDGEIIREHAGTVERLGDTPAKPPGKQEPPRPPTLRDWTELARELNLPTQLGIAVAAGRPELIRALATRKHDGIWMLKPEEITGLIELAAVLLETNQELQRHAAQLAERADHVRGNCIAVMSGLEKLLAHAEFRDPESESEPD